MIALTGNRGNAQLSASDLTDLNNLKKRRIGQNKKGIGQNENRLLLYVCNMFFQALQNGFGACRMRLCYSIACFVLSFKL
jgi:hypothetical protein